MLNCFEENALIYLLEHTKGVKFMPTINPDYYEIVIGENVCKTISKERLFQIFLKIYEVK